MPVNQFLPFGTGVGAYVLNYAAYQALAARTSGYPTGLLLKENLNSAIRQGNFVASALSEWVMTINGTDVNDDGVIANWTAKYQSAFDARWKTQLNGTFIVYAGNPNTHVAGVQGAAGTQFPSVVFDTTNQIWWVCTTTGNAAAAVWTIVGDQPNWSFWCGTSAGTANAPVLTTPVEMVALQTGNTIAWKIGVGPNTTAVTVTVGSFGSFSLQKDGPTGPVPLTGGELDLNNICTARYDGTILHLVATELGTAALADASSGTGVVVAISGSATVNKVPKFSTTGGTVADGYGVSDPTKANLASVTGAFVVNDFVVAADVAGTIKDGPTMSDPTKNIVAMVNGALQVDRFTYGSDITGTIKDSGYTAADFLTQSEAVMYRLGLLL